MLTEDRNEPKLHETKENGQNAAYLVLSPEERVKGFVRPLRHSYIHVGRKYKGEPELLDQPQEFNGKKYVATIPALLDEQGKVISSAFITKPELDQYYKNGRIGGCQGETTMANEIAETYARKPDFYGATFCVHCGKHIGLHEFVWTDTDETVGS